VVYQEIWVLVSSNIECIKVQTQKKRNKTEGKKRIYPKSFKYVFLPVTALSYLYYLKGGFSEGIKKLLQ